MAKTVYVVLAEGFEEIEASVPIDVLRRAELNVTVVGLTDRTVCGSHGLTWTADKIFSEIAETTPDLLVLPGGMPGSKHLGEHGGLNEMAGRVEAQNGYLAAICAAPAFTLASWGLLKGRKATCYPGCEAQSPDGADWQTDAVVIDGRIVTAKGPGVALDFAFSVTETLLGAETTDRLKAQMQFS